MYGGHLVGLTLLKLGDIPRYLVDDMVFHIISLPLVFYPMHFLWKKLVSKVVYETLPLRAMLEVLATSLL